MRLRSLLFVPGDRGDRIDKAAGYEADALILDLEDAVAPARKAVARQTVAAVLARSARPRPLFVRINPIALGMLDVDLLAAAGADAIVLPKADGAIAVALLADLLESTTPILPIANETADAMFHLESFAQVASRLLGLTWGAEDLASALGASTSREPDGRLTPPCELARSLTLVAARAAGVPAIDTVFPNLRDPDGLAACASRAARDGFSGMLAIHPAQLAPINRAFTPSQVEIDHARAVVAAFATNPAAGALELNGKMIDAPHLQRAMLLISLGAVL